MWKRWIHERLVELCLIKSRPSCGHGVGFLMFQPHVPVRNYTSWQRVKMWMSSSFCLAAGWSWCWQGSARRRVLPAGRGGWSLSTWGSGSSNASDGPTRSRFVHTQTFTPSQKLLVLINTGWWRANTRLLVIETILITVSSAGHNYRKGCIVIPLS